MKMIFLKGVAAGFMTLGMAAACERLDNGSDKLKDDESGLVTLEDVAEILAVLPLGRDQMNEVHDAVTSSSGNGYDEEYTMKHLFGSPGAGVGDGETKGGDAYKKPLRDMIEDYVYSGGYTKSSGAGVDDPETFLTALMESDIQIYWPFSENWDGEAMPVITFDPEDGAEVNIGYRLNIDDDGFRRVETVEVDEQMAEEVPVWVVNRNSDAGFTSLEMMRRDDPEWGAGGGNIIVRPSGTSDSKSSETKGDTPKKCLVLRNFTANKNFDSWFAGASEFFVKVGYLDDFSASTESELKLYDPMITDFMIIIKRSQIGKPVNFNAVMISRWSGNLDAAFMIVEDDGGTRETWSAKAKAYIKGKSYGIEISFPWNRYDDLVWRGNLSYDWIEKFSGKTSHYGDVDLTFELLDY